MTRLAQRHEIVHVVGAALTKRENVVYLLGRSQLAMLLALFAERVCFDKAVAYSFPSTTVTPVSYTHLTGNPFLYCIALR